MVEYVTTRNGLAIRQSDLTYSNVVRGSEANRSNAPWLFDGLGESGESVNLRTTLGITAYWCGIAAIAGAIASSPISVVRHTREGKQETLYDHPLHKLLARKPNPFMDTFMWKELLIVYLLTSGNSYNVIVTDQAGLPVELIPLDSQKTRIKPNSGRTDFSYLSNVNGKSVEYSRDRILHIRGMGTDGLYGLSPIRVFANSLGLSISTEKYGARFFRNSGRPSGVLTTEQALDELDIGRMKKSWELSNANEQAQGTAVLWGGMNYEPISLPPEEAQFLETRVHSVRDVARILNIPATKLRDTEHATYSNVEQESINFVSDTVEPWATRIESAMNAILLPDEDDVFVRFDLDRLLAGDRFTRYRAYAVAINSGFMLRNEAREMEQWETIDKLDDDLFERLRNPRGNIRGPNNGSAVGNENTPDGSAGSQTND